MESKYDKARYNKTYYEKNKDKLRELQRQKRRKMKEALQKVEAEEQAAETESQEPAEGLSKCFQNIRYYQEYALRGCRQWLTGCLTSCLQSLKEDHREQAEQYAHSFRVFLRSIRLTMVISNISNTLNILKFIIYIYNNIVW